MSTLTRDDVEEAHGLHTAIERLAAELGHPGHRELRDVLGLADPAAVEKHLSGAYERRKRVDPPEGQG